MMGNENLDNNSKVLEYLAKSRVNVSPETFTVLSINQNDWEKLLENPELSPRMTSPFLIFKDQWEITLVLDEYDFGKIWNVLENAKVERNFRLLSFDVELPFDVVGFMAQVTKIIADAEVSILPFSSFSRDHVLVKQDDLSRTLNALRGFVDEIC